MNEVILRNGESAQYIYAMKKNFIQKDVVSNSDSRLLIGHMSDIHGDIKRFENALLCFEHFGVDFAVHTGDTVTWNMSDDSSFFASAAAKTHIPLYNCIGNHETFDNFGKLTNAFLHEKLISPLKNIGFDAENGHYCVDFAKHKIRLIVLNPYDYDDPDAKDDREEYMIFQAQCDWLIKTLKEAAKLDFGVIIASHEADVNIQPGANKYGFCQRFEPHPWGKEKKHNSVVAYIVDAFKFAKRVRLDFTWTKSGRHIFVDEKFEENGDFICYLSGHRHGDYVGFLPGFREQLSICMTCSGCFPEGYHNIGEELSDLPRIEGTVTEDALNFYSVDRENKSITIVRLGACVNDDMRLRRAIRFKYNNSSIL